MKKLYTILVFFVLISVAAVVSFAAEEPSALPGDNLRYPVFITFDNTLISAGSGFYLSTDKAVYLVTAKHILYKDGNLIGKVATIESYPRDLRSEEPIIIKLDLEVLEKSGMIIPHPSEDIIIVKVGVLESNQLKFIKGTEVVKVQPSGIVSMRVEGIKKFENVLVGNDIFLFGYPISLQNSFQAIDYKKPLLRKGIIAGKNAKSKKIILDAPSYFGNSGGLVIEVDDNKVQKTFSAIGIVSETIPFIDQVKSMMYGYSNVVIQNSGYSLVVPLDFMLELIDKAENH
jgi:hypothetical protein